MNAEPDDESTMEPVVTPSSSGGTRISRVSETHVSVGQGSSVTIVSEQSAEFDAALTRAEALLRQVDHNRLLFGAIRALQLLCPVFTFALTAVALTAAGSDALATTMAAVVVALANAVLVIGLQILLAVPLNLQIRRDRVTMVETVDTLREQLGSLATEGDWTRSSYRLNRLRIERFPL